MFAQIIPFGPKVGPPGGHVFYIGLYRENMKILFHETTRLGALIFDMKHYLVDLNQVC